MSSPELLRSFVAAADTGSFSAAGRRLGKHQATISGNIARLEDELGVTLFDRVGKYPQLTDQGLALYDSARLVVEATERFDRSALSLSRDIPVVLSLGLDEDLPLEPIQPVLKALRQAYPDLCVRLHRLSLSELFEQVRDSKIDLALAPTIEGRSQFYEFRAIGQMTIKMVCSQQHTFAKKRQVSNDELLHATQLMSMARKNSPLSETARMSAQVWECQGHDALIAALQAQSGWAFLVQWPGMSLPLGLDEFQAEFAGVDFQMQYDLIWPKNHLLNEVEEFVCEQLSKLF